MCVRGWVGKVVDFSKLFNRNMLQKTLKTLFYYQVCILVKNQNQKLTKLQLFSNKEKMYVYVYM